MGIELEKMGEAYRIFMDEQRVGSVIPQVDTGQIGQWVLYGHKMRRFFTITVDSQMIRQHGGFMDALTAEVGANLHQVLPHDLVWEEAEAGDLGQPVPLADAWQPDPDDPPSDDQRKAIFAGLREVGILEHQRHDWMDGVLHRSGCSLSGLGPGGVTARDASILLDDLDGRRRVQEIEDRLAEVQAEVDGLGDPTELAYKGGRSDGLREAREILGESVRGVSFSKPEPDFKEALATLVKHHGLIDVYVALGEVILSQRGGK